jgi:hypothetical protein
MTGGRISYQEAAGLMTGGTKEVKHEAASRLNRRLQVDQQLAGRRLQRKLQGGKT